MKHLSLTACLALLPLAGMAQDGMPRPTTAGDTTWYCLSTPLRDNLHLTAHGNLQSLTGTAPTYDDNQLWCFVETTDGCFNLLNRQGALYMGERPVSQLYRTTTTAPAKGFRLSVQQDGLFNLADANGDLVNQCLASQKHQLTPYNYPNDPGNLFRLTKVTPGNAALAMAKNKALTFFDNTVEGTANAPGTFSAESRKAFTAALDTATTTASIDRALADYKATMHGIATGQCYFIVSTGPSYCAGRVVYNTKSTGGAYLRWGDKTIDANAMWELIDDGSGQTYQLRNKATGLYLTATSQPGNSGEVRNAETPDNNGHFELTPLYEGASFLLSTPGGNPLHAQQNFGVMVTWNSRTYGSASSWRLVPVAAEELAQAMSKSEEDSTDYQLVWNDEFDGTSINEKYWNFGEGFQRNNEAQWYQKENASLKDGCLVIEARKERRPNPWYEAGSGDWKKSRQYIDYTSSILTSSGKFDFLYGRLEVRAKIPCYNGFWPAIWLLGNESVTGPWPSSGEIDVMEYYKDKTWANLVWGSTSQWAGIWESRSTPVSGYWMKQDPAWGERFHTWRMDWDEESIKIYLDDELITICNLERTINQGIWAKVDNPFHTRQYLLLNMALGGNNGGTIDDNKLPMPYLVDFARVYQKPRHSTGVMAPTSGRNMPLVTPNGNQAWVSTQGFGGTVQIRVYDLSGRLVLTQRSEASAAGTTLSLSSLSAETYVVKASDGTTTRTQKIHRP